MKLIEEFNPELEPLINMSESLASWFGRNQAAMAYYELVRPNCIHCEGYPHDIEVLGRMANACLTYLEHYEGTDSEKVKLASMMIANIYEKEKENLSEIAKERFRIDIVKLEDKNSDEKVFKK